MRATIVTLLLLSLTSACGGDDTGGGDGDGDTGSGGGTPGSGGSDSGTGGGTPGSGGTDPGTGGGDATVADHEAACLSFCAGYQAQCGVACPETCDGTANTYGPECALQGVDYYECLSEEDPPTYNCDAGNMQNVIPGACQPEENDLNACFSVGGVLCERWETDDADCLAAATAGPFAYYCVSEAAPPECTALDNNTYCCPTE